MPANVIHVIAISVWEARPRAPLFVLPAATRDSSFRTADGSLPVRSASQPSRESPSRVLLITGLVQSYIEVRTIHNALHTAFGRAALIKFAIAGRAAPADRRVQPAPERPAPARDRERRPAPGRTGISSGVHCAPKSP